MHTAYRMHFVISLLLLFDAVSSLSFTDKYNAVTVDKNYVFVGELIALNCTTEKGDSNETLRFTRENQDLPSTLTRRSFDNQTIHLWLPALNTSNEGNYICWNGNRPIGASYISVDHAPEKITDLKCVAVDWDQKLVCEWEFGLEYQHRSDLEVTLFWRRDGISNRLQHYRSCKHQNITSYVFQPNELGFDMDQFYMMIEVKNIQRPDVPLVRSREFFIDTRLVTKPAPVYSLKAWKVNDTCISVTWKHRRAQRRKHFRIRVNEMWEFTSKFYIRICDLHPFTSYKISVAAISVSRSGTNVGYWGEEVETTIQMGSTTSPNLNSYLTGVVRRLKDLADIIQQLHVSI